jgi:MoaA/NifB/PqqE/SkfB family radical SAM enzyme
MPLRPLAKNFLRYGILQVRPPTPIFLILFVTRKCNMRCRHCFDAASGHLGEDLSHDEIANLSRELGPLPTLMLSGGEPFLREDLPEICGLFARNNKTDQISIPTNGFSEERIACLVARILDACPKTKVMINVSLDGLAKTHDAIRGVAGAFDKAIATVRQIREISKQTPRLRVQSVATLTTANFRELPALADLLREKHGVLLDIALVRGTPRDPSVHLPNTRELKETLSALEQRTGRGRKAWGRAANTELRLQVLSAHSQIVPCVAGRLVGTVYANGDVALCEMLESIGNLRETPFLRIWNSPAAERQRGEIRRHNCVCTHECFLSPSLAYNWKFPLYILRSALREITG